MAESITPPASAPLGAVAPPNIRELVVTLFELGREVTSVLDLDELLQKIPQLMARLTKFNAFAVYLLDTAGESLTVAYSVGYPANAVGLRMKVGEGLVGTAVAEGRPLLVNDVTADARYVEAVPGSKAELVVPLRRKGRVIGALNLLSENVGQFSEVDEMILRQFGAHVAVAIENARLFEHEREYTSTLETLTEISRDFAAILNLDELLTRIANLLRRLVDYRTFGLLLLNEETQELEMKVAVRYGDNVTVPRMKLGSGLVGYAALHKEAVLVPDVSKDPRYVKLVADARSELVVPLLLHDRCIGVFDLESPGAGRVQEEGRRGSDAAGEPGGGRDRECALGARRFAPTSGASRRSCASRSACRRRCCRTNCRSRSKVWTPPRVCRRRASSAAISTTFSRRKPNVLVAAVGDVSGKGVPAALYSAFVGELIRSRTFRRRFAPEGLSPSSILESVNTILCERQLEEYYCTLCFAVFDVKRRTVTIANSGLPYPVRVRGIGKPEDQQEAAASIEVAGVPLGSFPGSTYDALTLDLKAGDLFVFCSDGVFEANDLLYREFGTARLHDVINASRDKSAREIVDAIFEAVQEFRGEARAERRHDRGGDQDHGLIGDCRLLIFGVPTIQSCISNQHSIISNLQTENCVGS